MRITLLTLLITLLGACSALEGQFSNRLACTPRRDAYVVSLWTRFIGIATELDKRDAPAACGAAPARPAL